MRFKRSGSVRQTQTNANYIFFVLLRKQNNNLILAPACNGRVAVTSSFDLNGTVHVHKGAQGLMGVTVLKKIALDN